MAEPLGPLSGRRVLEIADEKGVYCGKLFADMGAEVIKIECPGGDATRLIPPFWGGAPHPEKGLFFLYTNTNKKSVILDLETPEGRDGLLRLIPTVDLVIETLPPGRMAELGLGYGALRALNPSLVMTSISGFGQTGPHSQFHSADVVAGAMGGAMVATGWKEDPPVTLAGSQSYIMASTLAASSSLIALHHAARSGRGQQVDISVQEATLAVTSICGVGKWLDDGIISKRFGTGLFSAVPSGAYRCLDGSAYLIVNRPGHWNALARWVNEVTGNEEILDPMFEGPSSSRQPYRELLDIYIEAMTRTLRVEDLYREGQHRHLAVTPLGDALSVTRDPHLRARGFYATAVHGEEGRLTYPGAPYRLSETPWRLRHPAPAVGADEDILRDLPEPTRLPLPSFKEQSAALGGLRVVEFTAGMAGPWIGRLMAHTGADVIKVESRKYPDVTRMYVHPKHPAEGIQTQLSPWFTDWNGGKRFVSLDLTKPEGMELARRLVAECDVVIDNHSTGVLDKLGLGFEVLSAIKPDLILLSSTGFGNTGPDKSYISWGPNIETLSGLSTLSGFAHRECTMTQFAYPDPASALHGLFAVLCALEHRQQSGKGQRINLSQLEATIASFGHVLMEVFANGDIPEKPGNGSLFRAPQGCYPCRGDDRWCAISVAGEEEWRRLCKVMDKPGWIGDPRFSDRARRLQHSGELDERIADWTRDKDAYAVMKRLQEAGVACGVVQDVEDQMLRDGHLQARGYFEDIPHRVKGTVKAPGLGLGLMGTPGKTRDAGRPIGCDNREVFSNVVGLSQEEFEDYLAAGIIER
jgi:crotonobetainyl-CoA:carnitine CoA-transferase CaiB-like acyl-CoA transferase